MGTVPIYIYCYPSVMYMYFLVQIITSENNARAKQIVKCVLHEDICEELDLNVKNVF